MDCGRVGTPEAFTPPAAGAGGRGGMLVNSCSVGELEGDMVQCEGSTPSKSSKGFYAESHGDTAPCKTIGRFSRKWDGVSFFYVYCDMSEASL